MKVVVGKLLALPLLKPEDLMFIESDDGSIIPDPSEQITEDMFPQINYDYDGEFACASCGSRKHDYFTYLNYKSSLV